MITTILPTPSTFKRLFLVLLGAVVFSFNMNAFVNSANLFPGGFSGISLLIQRGAEKFWGIKIPFTAMYWLFNAFPVYISFKFIGKKFTLYSLVMIVMSSLLIDFLPKLDITSDVLLCSIFGGIINGAAITFCLYADATSGGTDFIAIYFSEKKGTDMWNKIFAMNIVVLVIAGVLFGWDKALYSIVFQFSSTQVLNYLYQRYQKITMLIITDRPQELYECIKNRTSHDATEFVGKGCYKDSEKSMLYTVVSADEAGFLGKELKLIDPDAFINVLRTKELYGKFFTRKMD